MDYAVNPTTGFSDINTRWSVQFRGSTYSAVTMLGSLCHYYLHKEINKLNSTFSTFKIVHVFKCSFYHGQLLKGWPWSTDGHFLLVFILALTKSKTTFVNFFQFQQFQQFRPIQPIQLQKLQKLQKLLKKFKSLYTGRGTVQCLALFQ